MDWIYLFCCAWILQLLFDIQARKAVIIINLRNHKKFDLASSSSSGMVHFSVKELTRDHHPDRDDEKLRVETAGGYVELGGVRTSS